VSPEEIKQLRKDLKLTARQLADEVKAAAEDVWAWETGERFPTKRHVTRMVQLRNKGGSRAPKHDGSAAGLDKLADPNLWLLLRKLVAHPELFTKVNELAKAYSDPAASVGGSRKETRSD
jgi:transcriptional regulator with XRE-family HTH domain